MARIRSLKPDFFRDEKLQDLEVAQPSQCCMLVFSGLWTQADREGRFNWVPRVLKLDILPFLSFDMSVTLDLLESIGCLRKYEVGGKVFGVISNWERHQLPSRDEPPSEIPSPSGLFTPYDRPPNATVRARLYSRDNYTCAYCKRDLHKDTRAICLDHVIPYSENGTNRDVNLVTSCKKCNAIKSASTPFEANLPWPVGLGEARVNGVYLLIGPPVNGVNETADSPVNGADFIPDAEGVNGLGGVVIGKDYRKDSVTETSFTLDGAVSYVLIETGLAGKSIRDVIHQVIARDIKKLAVDPKDCAEALITAWRKYDCLDIQFKLGPEKFFGTGTWRKTEKEWRGNDKSTGPQNVPDDYVSVGEQRRRARDAQKVAQ